MMAKCPAHDDHDPSLSIDEGEGGKILVKCWGGCPLDNVLGAAHLTIQDLFPDTIVKNYNPPNGEKPPRGKLFDWDGCVQSLSDKAAEAMAKSRGFSTEFVSELKQLRMIGVYDNHFAVPVLDGGNVVGVQYRLKEDHSWRYHPEGIKSHVWVVGILDTKEPIEVFESNFDGMSFMERSGYRDNIIITRGTANAKAAANLVPRGAVARLYTQNDSPGEQWEADFCSVAECTVKRVKIPIVFKDFNQWMQDGEPTPDEVIAAITNAETIKQGPLPPKPLIQFCSPAELKHYKPPPGLLLVGDYHIVKSSTFVIGGAPGVFKSRSLVALARCGATLEPWLGLTVHRKFKSMILQNENGTFRLHREFVNLDCGPFEDYVRISPPPPFGLCFRREDFRAQLSDAIAQWEPDLFAIDPHNAVAREQDSREYLETFDLVRSVLPSGDDGPALVLLAHTRKPGTGERDSGRGLLKLLAGSYVLGSVPRCVIVLQAATDDVEDKRIVATCCKNNDGEMGRRTAWEYQPTGLFAAILDFDWDTFDHPDVRVGITKADMEEVFAAGPLEKVDAAKKIMEATGCKKTAAYDALALGGRFRGSLIKCGPKIGWIK